MKKLSLKNVQLSASNLLSKEEKKQAVGGIDYPCPYEDKSCCCAPWDDCPLPPAHCNG